ncbi:hypothetical protein ACFFHM_20780 [Halalkalibacter kiskunsagensis]|uniref:Secreted protein n=1 Tax=Halalkalibacter kiskunsagensis TaxID=1548599 RepID=A0ABV6KHN6_9BACI
MTKTVINWVFSAIAILIVIIGFYMSLEGTSNEPSHEHNPTHDEEENSQSAETGSTIDIDINYSNETLTISVLNQEGDIPDLAITHEKLMHLILISDDLESFIHLHPKQTEEGMFVVDIKLDHMNYQAFVDIKPEKDVYLTEPIPLDEQHLHHHSSLQADETMVKEIDGVEVELFYEPLLAGEHASLLFEVNNGTPEPYLGALGHVVIVDELLSTFIHVHPESTEKPVFEAYFEEAGMYKLWAEFKIDGEVYAFPYMIEVK